MHASMYACMYVCMYAYIYIYIYIYIYAFFSHQEKKTKYPTYCKHSQNKHLFMYFYFFHFISTQFADFAFLKIQMQITFANSFNVLNNTIWSML